jgi:hypothetical protein
MPTFHVVAVVRPRLGTGTVVVARHCHTAWRLPLSLSDGNSNSLLISEPNSWARSVHTVVLINLKNLCHAYETIC